MGVPVYVLMVANNGCNTESIVQYLRSGGFDPLLLQADSLQRMEEALMKDHWDVILFDIDNNSIALNQGVNTARRYASDLPFIVLADASGIEHAVAAIKTGAHDYIPKCEISRIVPAMESELREFYHRLEQRLSSEALRQSEEKYYNLVEAAQDIIFISDIEGRLTFVNGAFTKLTGKDVVEILDSKLIDYIIPEDRQFFNESLINQIRTGAEYISFEARMSSGGSGVKTIWFNCAPLKNNIRTITGFTGIGHDISDRISAETALKNSEEIFRSLAEQSFVGILMIIDGKIAFANEAAAQITGYSAESFFDMDICNIFNIIHKDDRQKVVSNYEYLMRENNALAQYDFKIITKNGEEKTVNLYSRSFMLEDKKAVAAMGFDITGQKQSKERIEALNECFLSFDANPAVNIEKLTLLAKKLLKSDAIVYSRYDQTKIIPFVHNNISKEYLSYADNESLICYDLMNKPNNKPVWIPHLQQTKYCKLNPLIRDMGYNTYFGSLIKCENENKGFLCLLYLSHYEPEEDDYKVLSIIASAVGIEEVRLKMEKNLINTNKELNDFAYMVSHDIKNSISLIKGFLQAIKEKPELFDRYYQRILGISDNVSAFVNDLLTLSQAGRIINDKKSADLKELMTSAFVKIKPLDIKTRLNINDSFPIVYADSEALQKVFENLFINAIQNRDPKKEELIVDVRVKQERKNIIITIRDNGTGIKEGFADKIFQAGFTLRKPLGTGFGLAIAKKIIEAHDGLIWADPLPEGEGAQFNIKLPCVAENKNGRGEI